MSDRRLLAAVLLLGPLAGAGGVEAAPPENNAARMSVIVGKDVSGTPYKRLGLPDRQYCWDLCLKEEQCSGVRWGVVTGDTAGLCMFMSGPLELKEPVEPKTDDGKVIRITVARKEAKGSGGT